MEAIIISAIGIAKGLIAAAYDAAMAATANDEAAALEILEKAIAAVDHELGAMRTQLAQNRADALAALDRKFPEDSQP